MYARAVDDAAERLGALRQEECGALGLAALALGMFADDVLVGGAIDAIDFVVGDVAVNPLDLGAEVAEDRLDGWSRDEGRKGGLMVLTPYKAKIRRLVVTFAPR